MGLKKEVITAMVSILMMATIWTIIDMGAMQGFTDDFTGKLVVGLVIYVVARLFGTILG